MEFGDTGVTGAPKTPSVGSILQGRPMRREIHFVQRIGWLRAAVLGANDGIISTAASF
jgi:VIT1/CCC1 family predicted Fe2+/Mn2+ transporter